MNPEVKEKWVAALESGEYEPGVGRLVSYPLSEKPMWCCLGVLCDVAVKEGVIDAVPIRKTILTTDPTGLYLPPVVAEWAGIDPKTPGGSKHGSGTMVQHELARINDASNFSFKPSIEYIKEKL